jgi:hypothetical protein
MNAEVDAEVDAATNGDDARNDEAAEDPSAESRPA